MQALFLVLHKVECLQELLVALQEKNINGGTIIESTGMMSTLQSYDNIILDSLRILLENPRDDSRVLFFILEEDMVNIAKECINEVLGGIENPNTGIMFGIDLSFVEGLNKKVD